MRWICILYCLGGLFALSTTAQDDIPVQIGVLLAANSAGERGARLAVNELNINGPRYTLILADDPANMSDALARFSGAQAIIGPADDALTVNNLAQLQASPIPVLTLATTDSLMLDSGAVFRVRAAERYISAAGMDFLLNELGHQRIGLVQTDVPSTEALLSAEIRLIELGTMPALKVQLVDNADLLDNLPAIQAMDAVAFWGPAEDAQTLRAALLAAGWGGSFLYRQAASMGQDGAGMIGIGGWSFATPTPLSQQFLARYVAAYGELPTDEAAAAYDAVYLIAAGVDLANFGPVQAVQGVLESDAGHDLSRMAAVYRMTDSGGAELLARYANLARLSGDDLIRGVEVVAAVGTITPTPTPSVTPSPTPQPTVTPATLQITVAIAEVPVFAGPATSFPTLGTLPSGERATVLGGDSDLTWFAILYRGQIGWLARDPAILPEFDPAGLLFQLPVLSAPPTPIGSPAPTSNSADLIIESVTLDPAQPVPGQPFVASVQIRNNGSLPSGPFTIATAFEPGAVFSSNNVPNLEAGASVAIPLAATLTGSGQFGVDVVVDIDNRVPEGEAGERNNVYNLQYRLDYALANQMERLEAPAGTQIDVFGGIPDLEWTGTALMPINGATSGVLTGLTYDAVSYDTLDPLLLRDDAGLSDAQIFDGVLVGMLTAEGQRAILRIESRTGTTLTLTFRVYE